MAKKRANGEGNIRKRKDGRWEGRYSAGYDSKTGKRIVKSVLGRTQAEVKEKLKTAIEETKGLDVSRSEEYTVATWLRTWYELYAKPNIRVATADRYQLMIETYTIPRIGDIKLTNAINGSMAYVTGNIKAMPMEVDRPGVAPNKVPIHSPKSKTTRACTERIWLKPTAKFSILFSSESQNTPWERQADSLCKQQINRNRADHGKQNSQYFL